MANIYTRIDDVRRRPLTFFPPSDRTPSAGILVNLLVLGLVFATFLVRRTTLFKKLRMSMEERPWCNEDTCAVSNDAISQVVSFTYPPSRTSACSR